MLWLVYSLGGAVVVLAIVQLVRRFASIPLGDLISVPIPRTAERPLAMGTRLDVGAALAKFGEDRGEVSDLIKANDDAELLRRYWRHQGTSNSVARGAARP